MDSQMDETLEMQVVVGTYDSLIRGLSFDLVHGGDTVRFYG